MSHIFISHSHEDLEFVKTMLQPKLANADLEVFRDSFIAGGEDWRKEIDQAIKHSFALILVMTPEAKASEYVTYEWAYALGRNVKVIPLMLKETELHPRLESLQYLNFTKVKSRPWVELIKQLRRFWKEREEADRKGEIVLPEQLAKTLELDFSARRSQLSESQKEILGYLERESARRESVPQKDFEAEFDRKVKSVYWRLECLVYEGFVEKEKTDFGGGRPRYNYRLSAAYQRWLLLPPGEPPVAEAGGGTAPEGR